MITLEKFEELMVPLKEYQKEYDEATKALEALSDSSYVVPKLGVKLHDAYIKLLSIVVNDKDEDIEYFVHECNLGETPRKMIFNDGKVFNMDSVETLYNAIGYENVN